MDKEEMGNRIKKVMGKILDIDPARINEETSNDKVKRWDSLRHMNLVLAVEQEFGIEFDDQQIPKMLNYKEIVRCVQGKVA
jgi:acyl carrier protein